MLVKFGNPRHLRPFGQFREKFDDFDRNAGQNENSYAQRNRDQDRDGLQREAFLYRAPFGGRGAVERLLHRFPRVVVHVIDSRPIIAPVKPLAIVPDRSARIASGTSSLRRSGIRPPMPAIMIPTEPGLAKPHMA